MAVRLSWRRRKRIWWRHFASPKMLLLASPAIVLPLVILILADNPAPLSPVDEAIEQLPVAGGGPTTPPLPGGSLPQSVSVKLYADSARPDAPKESIAIPNEAKVNIAEDEYNALHPVRLSREDLMIGQLQLVFTSPMDSELSNRIFRDFCNAKPGDPFYNVSLSQLPINGPLRDALVRWTRGAGASASATVCPRLAG